MQYVLSLSYGKDSLACLGAIEELGLPLDRIVHAEVWATDTIPADLPPMVEFKKKADKIILERYGIKVEHVCAMKKREPNNYDKQFYEQRHNKALDKDVIYGFPCQRVPWCNSKLKVSALEEAEKKTYEDMFYHVRESGNRKGQICGFPFPNSPECNSSLKKPVFDKIEKQDCISYVGIAVDEPNRFKILSDKKRSPLVEASWTEQMCREWCEKNDLLSPTYTTSTRGGCWFCHNQGVNQLRQLRHDYPDLWALLLKWDSDSPVTFHADGHAVHDFDKRFELEDEGVLIPNDTRFKWTMLDDDVQIKFF